LSQNKKNNLGCLSIIKEGRRRRYIGFFVSSPKKIFFEKQDMLRVLRKQCTILYNKNFKEMGLFLTKFNENKGILRCKHTEKNNTIDLLRSINKIGPEKVEIETLGTSGTIKSLEKKHMNY